MSGIDIVLASGSPRRRELLTALGWTFRIIVPDVDETAFPGEAPTELCLRLAAAKAEAVAERNGNSLIVAADTIVLLDGKILGKPADAAESLRMIRSLQGRVHEVLTGVGVAWKGRRANAVERTVVRFRALDEDSLQAYAATGEGRDKAGAYAIQGRGALLVSSIDGDYFNVVGLPLCRLSLLIEEMGLPLPAQWRDFE